MPLNARDALENAYASVQKSSARAFNFNIILIGLFLTPEDRRNSPSACSEPFRSRVVGNPEANPLERMSRLLVDVVYRGRGPRLEHGRPEGAHGSSLC